MHGTQSGERGVERGMSWIVCKYNISRSGPSFPSSVARRCCNSHSQFHLDLHARFGGGAEATVPRPAPHFQCLAKPTVLDRIYGMQYVE